MARVRAWLAADWPTPPAGAGRERLTLLLAFAALVVIRLPRAWWQGRFLDEEGTIFFAWAWHRPAGAALWRSFAGYLNLGANATTLAAARLVRAGVLPLERAPYLTMVLALLFQLLPALLLLTGRAGWLTKRWMLVASLLVVGMSPMTEEVFANVLHIQFHLALCAGLILALDVPRTAAARVGYGVLLFLAPLCGPGAIVLLPLFVLRCATDRDAGRLAQTLALGAGAAVQMLVFFSPSPIRGHLLDGGTIASILFMRLMALPFLGPPVANALGAATHASRAAGGVGWWVTAACFLAYAGALMAAAWRRRSAAIWLIAGGLAIGVVSFGAGMIVSDTRDWFSVGAGERYNFLPLVLVNLGLIALTVGADGRRRRRWLAAVVAVLFWGLVSYVTPIREMNHGPEWMPEVAAWHRDHSHPLAGWPAEWSVDLSDQDRPCTPGPVVATASDPSYCESAWLARVAAAIEKRRRER